MTTIQIIATEGGKLGPLNGPFELSVVPSLDVRDHPESETLPDLIGLVRTIVAGISSYNKKGMETSSNLVSFAGECFAELQVEAPEAAARLENLIIDCRSLPDLVRLHPIWKLDRAILAILPGTKFID